jgi:hypothetical protein
MNKSKKKLAKLKERLKNWQKLAQRQSKDIKRLLAELKKYRADLQQRNRQNP